MRKKHFYIHKTEWSSTLSASCRETENYIQSLYDNKDIHDLDILSCKLSKQSFKQVSIEYCFVIQYTYNTLDTKV